MPKTQSLYAANTKVSVQASRLELEKILGKYGARSHGVETKPDFVAINFELCATRYRLEVPMPGFPNGYPIGACPDHPACSNRCRYYPAHVEQAKRERWRAIIMMVKSKLELSRLGVSSVEKEFMGSLLLPGRDETLATAFGRAMQRYHANGGGGPLMLGDGK